jgi:hypothetical protein
MSKVIKSYKAFNQDFTCKGFQYEVGKEYECKEPINICRVGFHACENPFDVWNYYDMLDARYAEVEQSGDIQREERGDNSSKTCSSKIKIKAELKLADIINLGVEWLKEKTSIPTKDNSDIISDNKSSAQIGSSGDSAKIGSSGDSAKIDSTGEDSVICCAGQNSMAKAKIGSWITLSEWEYNRDKNRYVPICVKTEYVDGERIKADTWYKLIDGEFKEQ